MDMCRYPVELVLGSQGLTTVTCAGEREYGSDEGPGVTRCSGGLGRKGRVQ